MEQLSFYTVDFEYIKFLKHAEMKERGFSCVPDMDYGEFQKPKFVCGVALQMNGIVKGSFFLISKQLFRIF